MNSEIMGLLALMLLQESRRAARTSPTGELILLENQDRALWNKEQIAEGVALLEKALKSAPLRLLHPAGRDCGRSCGGGIGRRDRLAADCCALRPTGTNSAFAGCTAQSCRGHCHARWSRGRSGADRRGIGDSSGKQGELANYYLAHSARADMYRRLGRTAEARASYEKALALTQQEPERQFLQERIRQLKWGNGRHP